ncbi:TetR family transcriptional regulator C-terminal domain-containing protein [Paracoccus aminophilus]|uniref:Transcriptional regulator, TetR family n=1 Tax=Paracoccus aminophilus JCM 7686 TaxID=1367847 RepID=S5XWU9_PARAH|nr:TetR family transcriptional regulator C-terminal domain-containing protein [Paracoccus aminophilus]AGT09787.1 transcriptional regulator, TetR family [Paracoccus aminophilus JCM 7686]
MKRAEKRLMTMEKRREDLILAALGSIRKHGFMNSTISTISAESGLSRGLISHYFENKDELLFEAFRYLIRSLEDFHIAVVSQAGEDAFRKLLYSALVPFLRDQHYREVWLHFWSYAQMQPDLLGIHRDLWGRYRRSIRRRLERAATEREVAFDLDTTTLIYTQLIDGLWMGLVMEEAYDRHDCCRILRDWLCALFGENPADFPFDEIDLSELSDLIAVP